MSLLETPGRRLSCTSRAWRKHSFSWTASIWKLWIISLSLNVSGRNARDSKESYGASGNSSHGSVCRRSIILTRFFLLLLYLHNSFSLHFNIRLISTYSYPPSLFISCSEVFYSWLRLHLRRIPHTCKSFWFLHAIFRSCLLPVSKYPLQVLLNTLGIWSSSGGAGGRILIIPRSLRSRPGSGTVKECRVTCWLA